MSVFSRRTQRQPDPGSYLMQPQTAGTSGAAAGSGAAAATPGSLPATNAAAAGLAAGGNAAARQQRLPRLGVLNRALAQATGGAASAPPAAAIAGLPTDAASALARAHEAHQAVPQRQDAEAGARASQGQARSAEQALDERRTKAQASAAAEAGRRAAALAAAQAEVGREHAALPGLQGAVDHQQQRLQDNAAEAQQLRDRHTGLLNDPALQSGRQQVAEARRQLQTLQQAAAAAQATGTGAPGATTSPGGAPPSGPAPQQQIAQAQAELTRREAVVHRLEQAIAAAETAVGDCGTRRTAIQAELTTAQDALAQGQASHAQALAHEVSAKAAVDQLAAARAALTQAAANHQAPVQALDTAAQGAVQDAAAATQAHRDLAAATAQASDRIATAERDHHAHQAQVPVAHAARQAHQAAQDLLAPDAALRQAVQARQQAVDQARVALNAQPRTPGTPASTDTPAHRRLQAAQQALTDANAAVTRQETEVNRLAGIAHREQTTLTTLQTTADASRTAAAAADQHRLTAVATAAAADRTAQASAQSREALRAPADAALQQTGQAVEALCHAITPPPVGGPGGGAVTDDRSAGQKAKDMLVRRPVQALQTRMGPAKVDMALGPFSGSASTNPSTGFHDGVPPVRKPATGTSASGLKAVDGKVKTAAAGAASLLAGASVSTQQAARAPAAFGQASAFTQEVARMFGGTDGVTASTPTATRLADALLNHPNPDAAGRPDGHALRHEQALLVATVLRSITSDPAAAAQVYNALWSGPAPQLGGVTRRGGQPSPLRDVPDPQAAPDPALQGMVHETRRALAATAGGMQALLQIEGLSLPAATDPHRRHAEQAVEHYTLGLRAETALLRHLPGVAAPRASQDIETALRARTDFAQLSEPARLGTGNRTRGQHEHPATLATQAFLYARANLERAPGAASCEQHPEFKPAYVALRNGFTESGQGSDFHQMTKRLHKFVKYIDLACASPVAGPGIAGHLAHPVGAMRRKIGKDKTPLKTLMQSGPLGSNLGTVPGEHGNRLRSALNGGKAALTEQLQQHGAAMSPQARTQALLRLASMTLWERRVPEKPDPLVDLSQGIRLSAADVQAEAESLNAQLFGPTASAAPGAAGGSASTSAAGATVAPAGTAAATPTAPALHAATVASHANGDLSRPLMPATLHDWFASGQGHAVATAPTLAQSTAMEQLRKDVDILRGKAAIDDTLRKLQDDFDKADLAGRREILRQVLISVVAGGDMTDYSDGRKNGVGGLFGVLAAQVNGVGALTTGVTPVGEFNLDHTRTAVLKAGVASNTGVIFLGNETKVTEMIGGGVRFGAQAGVVNMSAQAMARLGGAHLFTKGLMIRTNKTGEEHQHLDPALTQRMTAANWKRMSELVVNSVFDIAGQPPPPAGPAAPGAGPFKPRHGGEMWAQMAQKVGDYRDISFGWNTGQSHQAHVTLGADGLVGVKAGPVGRFSAAGGLGLKHVFLNRSKAQETSGTMATNQAGSGSRTSLGAAASAGFSHPTIQKEGQPDVALFARHKVGVESELVLQAKNGLVRITMKEGKVQPNISYKHREFGVEDDFVKLVNGQRERWEPRLGVRREDGVLTGGAQALDGFLQQVANLPPGNSRLFIERKCLTQDAADTLTACMNRLEALERPGAPADAGSEAQIKALRKQIAAHVADEDSWQPFRLFVNQAQQRSRDSALGGEVRASGASPADKQAGPSGFAERFLGGGKVTLGGKVNTAHGGRDLITIDAMPERL